MDKFNNNISEGLFNELNKNIILIDCMDSIVYRNISLDDLLKKWANQMGEEFSIHKQFLLNYRREVVAGKMHNVVPIEMIYSEMADHCIYYKIIEKKEKELFCIRAHEIELDCEIQSQQLIEKTAVFLREQKTQGRKIYCVSDFRLPSSDILQFFMAKKIDKLFDEVFSSSEFGVTKKKGNLYPMVLSKINASPSECIMIGDNYKSDCVNANLNGIKSYWLKNMY